MIKSKRFFNTILAWFFHDLGSTFDSQILPKMGQKHVGIDLEPQNQKVKKMTPFLSFFFAFLVPRGAEKPKKSRKNDSKMRTKIYRFFQPILKRFLLDFPPIWDPKISKSQPKSHAKSKQKNTLRWYQKSRFGPPKWTSFFTFLATKIDPWRRLGPIRASKQKSISHIAKKITQLMKKVLKMTLKISILASKMDQFFAVFGY